MPLTVDEPDNLLDEPNMVLGVFLCGSSDINEMSGVTNHWV